MTVQKYKYQNQFGKISATPSRIACICLFLITVAGCSKTEIDQAASKPSAAVETAVTDLNESGAEIVLDSDGEVVAVKLPEKTTPEVIATLTSLSKLKRVDATETDLKQPAFAALKSQNPKVEIELPH
ncbi:hypothetical protein [Gimesia fumaroli]|uniref:Uncharacterized protein n=1 Tax=Gimesia fumaroli TaxID=2527976 RepID=A0A518I787_9PLAN|nr:hypothetical protein [Gimesia fumaroli]QDV48956.1 hypothetical protein Enr17x_09710 [Gimesia fumaroli]